MYPTEPVALYPSAKRAQVFVICMEEQSVREGSDFIGALCTVGRSRPNKTSFSWSVSTGLNQDGVKTIRLGSSFSRSYHALPEDFGIPELYEVSNKTLAVRPYR